jgi:antitoxin ParD1/3/4
MSDIERMTITLPASLAGFVKKTVHKGDYASSSELIREALRDWKLKQRTQKQADQDLRASIKKGIADIEDGRVENFDVDKIVAQSLGPRRHNPACR